MDQEQFENWCRFWIGMLVAGGCVSIVIAIIRTLYLHFQGG